MTAGNKKTQFGATAMMDQVVGPGGLVLVYAKTFICSNCFRKLIHPQSTNNWYEINFEGFSTLNPIYFGFIWDASCFH